MQILMILVTILAVIIGVGSSLGIVVMLFGTLGLKIYRKIRYGMSLYD
ncbi:MAG: hypothetical protein IJX86_07570 [Lachnospiraceae bacterium]|mgnify:CR=1 FL=1|nr:hypothetical protein [Lachnospiraceae bacterium]